LFLLTLIVTLASAAVESPNLRSLAAEAAAESRLSFWSLDDFSSTDAAAQLLGHLGFFIKDASPSSYYAAEPSDLTGTGTSSIHLESASKVISSPLRNHTYGKTSDAQHVAQEPSPSSCNSGGLESACLAPSSANLVPRGGAAENENVVSDPSKNIFSFFQKGDGSETDPDGIPLRYLAMNGDDRKLAKKAVEATLQWRAEKDVDTILTRPHPTFDICKEVFPHSFVGRDPELNKVLFLQRLALIDLPKASRNGVDLEDLLMHYVHANEFLWQILEADDSMATLIPLMDLSGLHLSILKRRDIIAFAKIVVTTMDSHYPQRSHKTLLVNTPRWFNMLYKFISPLLRESTKAKIEILSRGKKQDEALKKYVGEDAAKKFLPESFWSSYNPNQKRKKNSKDSESDDDDGSLDESNYVLPVTELEEELRAYVISRLEEAGMEMQQVLD